VATEENFFDFVASSCKGGNNPETKEHLDALSIEACSGIA